MSCALFLIMGMTSIQTGDVSAADRDAEIEMLLQKLEDLEKKRDAEIETLKRRIQTLEEERSARRDRGEEAPSDGDDSALATFKKILGDREFKIGFRTQGWYQFLEGGKDGRDDDLNDFMIRRAYLYLKGKVTEDMGFFAHIAADRIGQDGVNNSGMGLGTGVAVRDAWIYYNFSDAFKVQLGRMYIPFTRNYGTTSTFASLPLDLTFAQGGVRGGMFYSSKVGRDDGIVLWGNPFDGKIQYRLGVFDGVEGVGNKAENLRYAGRVSLNLLEPETSWFNKGTYLGKKKVLALGFGFDYQDHLRLDGFGEKTSFGWTADLFYDHPVGDGAVTMEAAYIRIKNATQKLAFSRLEAGRDAHLYYVQGGYLLPGNYGPGRIQPYFRWEQVAVDSAPDTMIPCAGVNYYLKGHDAKLTVDWSLLHQRGGSASFAAANKFTGNDQNIVTFQASVGF
jgi:hypothetical protein